MQQTARSLALQKQTLSDQERSALLLLVGTLGERAVITLVCVCRQTLGRALGGLRIQRGSAALIRSGLARAQGVGL
jgi:hypothetical protein